GVFLAGLRTARSRETMKGALNAIARELGARNALEVDWRGLRHQHAAAIRSRLSERLAPATVNKVLTAFRGVTREAMLLGLLPPEDHDRIADVRGAPCPRRTSAPERCTLCRRADCAEVDAALSAGEAVNQIAGRFGISLTTLKRHARHRGGAPFEGAGAEE